ncbi:hypothetical protein [Agrobacterium sp. NPDC090283]|uniref:hypothetical protein n=1 Tax=Agrobacterium sp. NPDC090283 TaxID=3363920 RepID=UPI00383A2A5C
MRKKLNQKCASGASAIAKIAAMRDAVDDMHIDVDTLCCLAIVTESGVQDILFDKRAVSDRPGFYYADDGIRRVLGYSVSQVEACSRNIETAMIELAEDLREVHRILELHSDDASSPSGLAAVVAEWRTAYEAWAAADKGNSDQYDTPEGLRERQALIALAQHPCSSLDEVRRKADLFQTDQYLNGNLPDLAPDLLRSFAEAAGA